MKKIFTLYLTGILVFGLTLSAHATMIDLGGGMFYESDQNLIWLSDANQAGTTMNWSDAMLWADGLEFGGYNNWRLPTNIKPDGIACLGLCALDTELGYMYYTNDPQIQPYTTNVPTSWTAYWTSTYIGDLDSGLNAYANVLSGPNFGMAMGREELLHAWAVRDCIADIDAACTGDSSSQVPEPSALFLLGSGLAGLAFWRRRRQV